MNICKRIFSITLLVFLSNTFSQEARADIVGFEELTLQADSFYNGGPTTNTNGWTAATQSTGLVNFGNSYNSDFGGFWNGFSYSNVVDSITAGFGNQYAAFPQSGADGSSNYAIGFSGSHAFVNLQAHQNVLSVQVSNTTYAALSMLNGDSFAKQFGGASGDDPDFFSVTFTGFDAENATGNATGSNTFFLADYRFADNNLDYVVDTWNTVSLTMLGNARSIGISFDSSDIGAFGINTPTYVALDNLSVRAVPEPSSWPVIVMACACMIAVRRGHFVS